MKPKLSNITLSVTYREIGEYAEQKLAEMFPGTEFIIEDIEDDDEGIYFTYGLKEDYALAIAEDLINSGNVDVVKAGLYSVSAEDSEGEEESVVDIDSDDVSAS